jgi:hypothetical protein
MPKITCYLSPWFGVLIGVSLGLLSTPSGGRAQIVATLTLPVERLILAAHTKQYVCASVVLANEPLLISAILGAAAFAAQIIIPQEKEPAYWLRQATALCIASTQS